MGLYTNKPKSLALAMTPEDERLPIDASGYPIGRTTDEVKRVIKPPAGVTMRQWGQAIEVAVEYFRMTSGMMPITQDVMVQSSSLSEETWDKIYADGAKAWKVALSLKGVMKKGAGLTLDQLRALRYLTDVTVNKNLEQKLRHLGISWEIYQNWMHDSHFRSQMEARSDEILNEAQAPVMQAMVQGALQGKLENIKYFHAVTGRFRESDTGSDTRAFLSGLVEILQGEIKDPEQLKRIAVRLQSLKDRTLDKKVEL